MAEVSRQKKTGLGILAILLWLVCFALALEDIYMVTVRVNEVLNAGQVIVYALAFVYLIVIIATTEYHFKHFATPKSWRLFAWTFGIEILIFLLCIFF